MKNELKKRCYCCKNNFPLSEYTKDKRNKDGLSYYCFECRKEKTSKLRHRYKGKYKGKYKGRYEGRYPYVKYSRDKIQTADSNPEQWKAYLREYMKTYYRNNGMRISITQHLCYHKCEIKNIPTECQNCGLDEMELRAYITPEDVISIGINKEQDKKPLALSDYENKINWWCPSCITQFIQNKKKKPLE